MSIKNVEIAGNAQILFELLNTFTSSYRLMQSKLKKDLLPIKDALAEINRLPIPNLVSPSAPDSDNFDFETKVVITKRWCINRFQWRPN